MSETQQQVAKKDKNVISTQQARASKPKKSEKHNLFSTNGAWVVQLGTFAYPEHVTALTRKLKADGLPAYTRKTYIDGSQLTIVLVGPIVRKEDAKKLLATLDSKFKLKGIIVRYGIEP